MTPRPVANPFLFSHARMHGRRHGTQLCACRIDRRDPTSVLTGRPEPEAFFNVLSRPATGHVGVTRRADADIASSFHRAGWSRRRGGTADLDELRAGTGTLRSSPWDTSWIDRFSAAQFRVVFNASDISDGAAMNYASAFYSDYHEVHNTSDGIRVPVIVFRRLGTPMAFNDAMWEKYAIGEDTKTTDGGAPAKRNCPFGARAPAHPLRMRPTRSRISRREE